MAGLWSRFMSVIDAGLEAWRGGAPVTSGASDHEAWDLQLRALWALHTGDLFSGVWRRANPNYNAALYADTRLGYSHANAVNSFYEIHTYLGALPTDGKRLPDGSRGAIPVDPQTGSTAGDDALLAAVAQWWNRANWQQGMSQGPLYAAALGVAFEELIDDPARHAVWPSIVWPGYVVDLALDFVGNVKAYALEYRTTRLIAGEERTGLFRKEVDGLAFRYYWDDRPWTDPGGHGDAEQENPYGFVPAVWRQHRKVGGDRGLPAITGTRQALEDLNSILSDGIDYQHKAFASPVGVRGGAGEVKGAAKQGREYLNLINLPVQGGFEMLQLDIGKTLEIVKWLKEGIIDSNPEARFYQELRQMSSLTGPAVQRAVGDAAARVDQARKGHDPQTVKEQQMAIAISGWRLNSGAWENPSPRDEVFRPFDLKSYAKGALDMAILSRPVVEQTYEERIREQLLIDSVETVAGLVELGFDKAAAAARIGQREAALVRRAGLNDGFGGTP